MRVIIRSVDEILFSMTLQAETTIGTLKSNVCDMHKSSPQPTVGSVRLVHKGQLLLNDDVRIEQLLYDEDDAEEITFYMIISTTSGSSSKKSDFETYSDVIPTSENCAGNLTLPDY